MAIHPTVEAPDSAHTASNATAIDIEAWTEQATAALSSITISAAPTIPGASVTLKVPLDDHPVARQERVIGADVSATEAVRAGYARRREPLRRDSLKRRDALLKGKEGSRRRQRWENDRLLNNPYAQPPLPSDWEVRPTYPVHSVPYYLAPLWDAEMARSVEKRRKGTKSTKSKDGSKDDTTGKVPKELREKLKRSRAAKGLLQELEDEVRKFVEKWESKEKMMEQEGMVDPDSEDDEIVFVGRNGQMNDMRSPRNSEEIKREKLLFHSPVDDHGAGFGRWLVHHIGSYYGLRTWSVTVGNPARREAYVGIKGTRLRSGHRLSSRYALPRPLSAMV
ncbi:hypothetical protein K432DRAFT_377109 [Lepidopterella palustris CBS 459.81]|uniref:R3H-associated N-terminal domain-containing protein n=1 Tax=Lepidopterella palustris CBS 459.81 TaxID=1314670 RepID=A0A8E2JKR5_9PEZI|nr:hypothetical protein K432DRAFT_377109 [Lepidopterella palustris CBS 459.81]